MPMTIKEKIEAYVKAQGNQVGAGAELAAILNDIVDAIPGEYILPPASAQTLGGIKVGENLSITEEGVLSAEGGGGGALIVEGGVSTAKFVPDAGQPTYSEAEAAFKSGRTVILRSEAGELDAAIVACEAQGLCFYDTTTSSFEYWQRP